jgi:oxygen-independent coproporphyrinogen III oxidase
MSITIEGVPQVELTRRGFVTNYPPYRYWRPEDVSAMLEHQPLNVYIHTPYCIQRCSYCHYKTTTLSQNRRAEIDQYVDALCSEVTLASQRFHLSERPVKSVYFGGGTPTLLSEANLNRLMETLRARLNFAGLEIVVEAEPVTLTSSKADALKRLGVNRISLGIQSFCDEIVLQTGRHDKEHQAIRAIELAKETGAIVNIDLLSGLAGENHETWAYSVERALTVDVHAITIYKMELYANSEYYADVRRKTIELPSDELELQFMRYAVDRLEEAGYQPSTFFTFTKDGQYGQQHIRNRWRGEDLCSIGVSAFGSYGNWLFQNTSVLDQYISGVQAGRLPIQRAYALTGLDLMVRHIILGMKLLHLDLQEFKQQHGIELRRVCGPALENLKERGFIAYDDRLISLTKEGLLYGDYVGNMLGACLQKLSEEMRWSFLELRR